LAVPLPRSAGTCLPSGPRESRPTFGGTCLFSHGFTTKKTGHGFGLHISALSATELKGRISGTSAGPGQGATFTLELPLALQEATP
jgi:sensor histidine kinase regulating citrate/malate metabolism